MLFLEKSSGYRKILYCWQPPLLLPVSLTGVEDFKFVHCNMLRISTIIIFHTPQSIMNCTLKILPCCQSNNKCCLQLSQMTSYDAIFARIHFDSELFIDRKRNRYHVSTYRDNDCTKLKCAKQPSNYVLILLSILKVNYLKQLKIFEILFSAKVESHEKWHWL